jgi:hypothetical protein
MVYDAVPALPADVVEWAGAGALLEHQQHQKGRCAEEAEADARNHNLAHAPDSPRPSAGAAHSSPMAQRTREAARAKLAPVGIDTLVMEGVPMKLPSTKGGKGEGKEEEKDGKKKSQFLVTLTAPGAEDPGMWTPYK